MSRRGLASWRQLLLAMPFMAAAPVLLAQTSASPAAHTPATPAEVSQSDGAVSDWLARMHEGARRLSYIGTFVVSSQAGMASAKIWHVCDGDQQAERVESLSGVPRSTFRRNEQVITFLPQSRLAVAERRAAPGLFAGLLQTGDSRISKFYTARRIGVDRVAGFDAEVVQLQPRDQLRYGYRVWNENKTGMLVKLQTLDVDGHVLEQSAFSELQLDAPVSMGKLEKMMANTEGYKVERPEMVNTTAAAEGWEIKSPAPGFNPVSCFKRPQTSAEGSGNGANAAGGSTMQWIFSDGIASVSLFVEAFDRRRHGSEGLMLQGATRMLTRRMGGWWLTVVGEAPLATLVTFANGIERTKTAPK